MNSRRLGYRRIFRCDMREEMAVCFRFSRKRRRDRRKAHNVESTDSEYQELDDIMEYMIITEQDVDDLFD